MVYGNRYFKVVLSMILFLIVVTLFQAFSYAAGSGIAIIVVSILGIKYLMTSPSEKAEVKKQAIPVVIGCALLFGAVNIADIVYKFATGAFE